MRSIKELQAMVHELAVNKGWYDNLQSPYQPHTIAAWLCNIHGEVSEALECVRGGELDLVVGVTGKPTGFPSELADVVIRCLDTAGAMGIDLGEVIEQKHAYNQTRPYRHGNKRL